MFTNRPAIETSNGSLRGARNTKNDDGAVMYGTVTSDVYHIRNMVQRRLLAETEGEVNLREQPQIRSLIETFFNQVLAEDNLIYSRVERDRLLEWVISDILGYGPLEPLLQDETVTEVMANGHNSVYVERFGIIEKTNIVFENDAHLMRIIDRIVSPLGRRVDESSPMVDARLPNGYRVNATIPPLAIDGPSLTIRKFATTPYTAQDLIANQTLTPQLVLFLKATVEARINMIISGGTGTGKTTLLNVVTAFIPTHERIVTIEDTAELQLKQDHVVRTEYRPPNIALDMLQAMNTGHDGSLTTIHSNSPRDTLRRIETMVLMAGLDLPLKAIREQLASAIDLVVHMGRLRDGTRKVVKVTEVQGMEGESVVMQDLFIFEQTGIQNGRVLGSLQSTGLRPKFADKFEINNIELPADIFSGNSKSI